MVTASYINIQTHHLHSMDVNNTTSNCFNMINDWRHHNIQQPYYQFEALYKHAKHAQIEFNLLIKKTALDNNCSTYLPGQKSRFRAQQKIIAELNGKPNMLTDLVRGSVIATNINDLISTYNDLIHYADVCGVKNRFSRPTDSGYRDIKLLIRLPNSHFIVEIQLHLKEIATIKNGAEHSIYEQIQKIERRAMIESRSLLELEQRKIQQLRQQSQCLYQHVWQQYIGNNRLAS